MPVAAAGEGDGRRRSRDAGLEKGYLCACGRKATVNARIDGEGHVVTEGAQVFLGGNDSYIAMCHACWRRRIARERAERTQKEKQ